LPQSDAEIVKVRSNDGVTIACERAGSGPPLVLVHGSGTTRVTWRSVFPLLAEHFTVYALDRRGRGDSGDGSEYALEREFEDVAAVLDVTGHGSNLLGHSFGGLVALETALLTDRVGKLVVYEAVTAIDKTPPEFIERLEGQIRAGDLEQALVTFLLERANLSAEELQAVRSTPTWPERVRAAPTLPRELRAHNAYRPPEARLGNLAVPTLLLSGSAVPEYRTVMERMEQLLPNARLVVLEGQGHVAHATTPDLFASQVVTFLSSDAEVS
jgi:pimeloyl-ACP methyl ester carboxylesterase